MQIVDPLSKEHFYLILGIIIFSGGGFILLNATKKYRLLVEKTFGYFLIIKTIIFTLLGVIISNISIRENLPLHMCDISAILCAIYLIKPKQFLIEYNFYYGWFGAFNAIATPMFIHGNHTVFIVDYIIQHSFIFSVVSYAVFIKKVRLSNQSYVRASLITLFFIIMPSHIINILLGTNYIYTRFPPFENHPLIFGKWPWYFVGFILFGAFIALISHFAYMFIKNKDIS